MGRSGELLSRRVSSVVAIGMTEVPQVIVEGCNGVEENESAADADVAHQNGDDDGGYVTSVII